ncbi:MAG: hypothetical protein PHY10_04140, partial [Patescibacteria group bacterium]|nr:hypothetical protein [Patescibacteria group bacterium]
VGSQADTFVLKAGSETKDWQVSYFVKNSDKWDNISLQMLNGYRFGLQPNKNLEFKMEISVPESVQTGDFAEFGIATHSLNDPVNKIDAAKVRVNIDTDLDKDGMSDLCEVKYGLNPKDPSDAQLDLDGDFVINKEECTLGTNPKEKDTDGDGLWDGAIVENTKLILPGLKSDHFVIAGPVKSIIGTILPEQTINFNLINATDNKSPFNYQANKDGMLTFQINKDLIIQPGGYNLQTIGNGKVFQENQFFVSPYGHVYKKKNHEPMANVTVNLYRCGEGCCQFMASTITDENGVYDEFMLPAGSYRLKVNQENFNPYASPIFTLSKDGNKIDILLGLKTPAWLIVLYWVLGLIGFIILVALIWKLKDAFYKQEILAYQPDAQIKNGDETDDRYLGDTIYNLDGLGQSKEQEIAAEQTAVFHLKVQNDGRGVDKFLVQAYPDKNWNIRFFNILEDGNEITSQILGTGWESGNLASGLTKEVRLEISVKNEEAIENRFYEFPIQVTSINDPSKSDVAKARVRLIEKEKPVNNINSSHNNNNNC